MEPHERVNRPLKEVIKNNFIGGIFWALGATIGISIILTIVGLVVKQINLVPIVGGFLSEVFEYIMKNNSSLPL